MKRINLIILLFIFLISIIFISCPAQTDSSSSSSGKHKNSSSSSSTHTPGSNLPSAITSSTPLTLPSGVSINKMNGGVIGTIYLFPTSLILTNNTTTTYNYTFNAGANFWADTGETQNLIIVWDVNIAINPGDNAPIILPTFCLNYNLSGPEADDNFILGTIYTDGCMGLIINILSTKNPATFDMADIVIIQSAIWECMNNGSLSAATINDLNNL